MNRVFRVDTVRRRSLSGVLVATLLLVAGCAPAAPAATPTAAPKPTAAAPAASPAVAPVASPAAASASPAASPAAASPAALPAASPAAAVPSPSLVAAAPSGPLTKVTADFSARIGANLPLWYAAETGIFQRHGLDVDVQYIASSNAISALVAGQVQFAQAGGAETLSANAGGADLKVIGSTCSVYPFVFEAAPEIKTVDDLKGKRVGVSSAGSSSDIATRAGLKKVGLNPDTDVEIVAVGSLQNRMAALQTGAIQGGVAQPPEQLALEAKGFHALFDLAALKLPSSQNSIEVKADYLAANRDVAQRYMDAITEAIAKLKKDKPGSIKVLQKYLQNDDQHELEVTYDFFTGEVIPDDPSPFPAQYEDDVAVLSAKNPAVKNIDLSKMLDTSLAKSAMDRGLNKS